MSLSAWERQALDAIKEGLAGSDPELTALLSAFTRLASGELMPEREEISARSRQPLRLRAWRRRSLRRMQSLGFQRAALLLLWVLTTAALIAVVVVIGAGDHGTCDATVTVACAGPAPGHSSPSRNTTTNQVTQQRIAGIPQTGP